MHITYKQVCIVGSVELRYFDVCLIEAAFISAAAAAGVGLNYAERSVDIVN